jgi:hypothetical protein
VDEKAPFEVVFDVCPVCGERGDFTEADTPGRDSSDTEEGNGVELVLYKGERMCRKCRTTKIMQDESEPMMERVNREDEERAEMGFVKDYTA